MFPDPYQWSFPLGRWFGVHVRVHVFFALMAVGLILRAGVAGVPKGQEPINGRWLDATMVMGLLFFVTLLHEFGRCYAARLVHGEAQQVLLWPLGGLANVEIPQTPRANLIVATAGPFVNLLVCLVCGLALGLGGEHLQPPWSPFPTDSFPYRDRLGMVELVTWSGVTLPVNHLATLLLARLFWVSYLQLLLNMVLVGFPLDGGRILQSILWRWFGYHHATGTVVFLGFGVMLLVGLAAIVFDILLALFLVWFIYKACALQYKLLEMGGEESLFGYDFSQGYTSLERDQPMAAVRKGPNWFQRWSQRRAARKRQRELEQREAEDRRMDELLEKIHTHGRESLTEEEKRFLERVSGRYRNRQ